MGMGQLTEVDARHKVRTIVAYLYPLKLSLREKILACISPTLYPMTTNKGARQACEV